MPRCFVKQPDGRYAIWSSVVDSFVAVNCTIDEAIAEEVCDKPNYPGNLRADLFQELVNIERKGRAWKWAPTFDEALKTIRELHGDEKLEKTKLLLSGACRHSWVNQGPFDDGHSWEYCPACEEIQNYK